MKASLPVSTTLMRIVGYGLLLLSLLDMMAMLLPFRLTDAGWRFQIFGELIERIVVPLLAVMLIFYGESQDRKKQSFLFFAILALSWIWDNPILIDSCLSVYRSANGCSI